MKIIKALDIDISDGWGGITAKNNMAVFHDMYEEFVPSEGRAETKAGEILRAAGKLVGDFEIDGWKLGIEHGCEECNPAGRFLKKETNPLIAGLIDAMWNMSSDYDYRHALHVLCCEVIRFLSEKPALFKDDRAVYKDEF